MRSTSEARTAKASSTGSGRGEVDAGAAERVERVDGVAGAQELRGTARRHPSRRRARHGRAREPRRSRSRTGRRRTARRGGELRPRDPDAVAVELDVRPVALCEEIGRALAEQLRRQPFPALDPFVELPLETRERRHDEEVAGKFAIASSSTASCNGRIVDRRRAGARGAAPGGSSTRPRRRTSSSGCRPAAATATRGRSASSARARGRAFRGSRPSRRSSSR